MYKKYLKILPRISWRPKKKV